MRQARRWLTAAVAATAAVSSAGAVASAPASPSDPLDRISTPADRPIVGFTRPARRATLSAPLEGTLARISVRVGDRVQPQDLLATIDDRVQVAAVRAAEARVQNTAMIDFHAAALRLAERKLELLERSGGTPFEIINAEVERDQAAAQKAAAEQAIAIARTDLALERAKLERHRIRAPFAGRIVRIPAREGETLTHEDPVLEIIDLRELEAELHVPAVLYPLLRVGATYVLAAGPPADAPLEAVLTSAEPVIDPSAATVRCVFTIRNHDEALPSGFDVVLDPARLRLPPPRAAGAGNEPRRP